MKVDKLIKLVQTLKPPAFDKEILLMWVSECEGMVLSEVHLVSVADIEPFALGADGSLPTAELTAPFPYDKLYTQYVLAQIDYANGEYTKYQNSMQMFNATYTEYVHYVAEVLAPADGRAELKQYYLSAYAIAQKHGYSGTEEQWLASLHGADGKATKMQYAGKKIQWALDGSAEWVDLVDMQDIQDEITEDAKETITATAAQAAATATAAAQAAKTAAEAAAQSASADALEAGQHEQGALQHVDDAESWATGQMRGQDVGADDVTYHNNAKYWAQQAQENAGADAVKYTPQTLTEAQKAQARSNIGVTSGGGGAGEPGTTFTPSVSEAGVISWTNDGGLENPTPVNIKGPQGEPGEKGEPGVQGPQGEPGTDATVTKAAIKAALGYTPRKAWYVTVTNATGGIASADKTEQEVYDAYQAGYAVYAIANLAGETFPFILPLLAVVKNGDDISLGFACTGTARLDVLPYCLIAMYSNGFWVLWKIPMGSLGVKNADVGEVLAVASVADGVPTSWQTVTVGAITNDEIDQILAT